MLKLFLRSLGTRSKSKLRSFYQSKIFNRNKSFVVIFIPTISIIVKINVRLCKCQSKRMGILFVWIKRTHKMINLKCNYKIGEIMRAALGHCIIRHDPGPFPPSSASPPAGRPRSIRDESKKCNILWGAGRENLSLGLYASLIRTHLSELRRLTKHHHDAVTRWEVPISHFLPTSY